jgi:hypothetical protein
MGLRQDFLQHERVHVDHAVLDQMQRQHAGLVILPPVADHLAAAGEVNAQMAPGDTNVGSTPTY